MKTKQIKYMTAEQIKEYAPHIKLEPGTKCPVAGHMIHNDETIRVLLCVNAEGSLKRVDIPMAVFMKLPVAEVPSGE